MKFLVFNNKNGLGTADKLIVNWDSVKYIKPIDGDTFYIELNNGAYLEFDLSGANTSPKAIEAINRVVKANPNSRVLEVKPRSLTDFVFSNIQYRVAASGSIDGGGTANTIPVFIDADTIGDSALIQAPYTPGGGLAQLKLTDGYRFIIDRAAAAGAGGDQEYAITQDNNNKVSFGWDDDGAGFGFLYNWAGFGWRIGAQGNNPMLEIITTAGSESVNLHKQVEFKDYGSGTYSGTLAKTLGVTASGDVIEFDAAGIAWPFQYSSTDGNLLQGENPGTTQIGTTTYGVGAGANLSTPAGGAPGDSGNTAFGFNALGSENSEGSNTAVGYRALGNQNVSTMFAIPGNTALGYEAGKNCTTGLSNVFIGRGVQSVNSGQSIGNVALGSNAMEQLGTGFANVAIGERAMQNVNSNTGNIAIGYTANNGNTTGNQNVVIGYNAQPSSLTVSNEITLGNSSTAVLRCQQTSITALSDERDKKSIEDLPYGIDFINKLQPRKFIWDNRIELREEVNDDGTRSEVEFYPANKGKKDFGFIAQEVQAHDDDVLRLVYDENPDKLEMSYGKLVPVLVKAIQELSAKVTALENA